MNTIPTNHDSMIIRNKINKIADAEPGNIPIFSEEDQGSLKDSGKNISEIGNGGGGGGDNPDCYGAPALEILIAEVELKPFETTKFSVKSTFKKFDLRTIRVKTDLTVRVYFYENSNMDNPCYISVMENDIYDILNLPYVTENLDGTLIGKIENASATSETVKIEIRVTSLQ